MRLLIVLALLAATPADAWQFTANPVCTLTHETDQAGARVTYDPRQPQPYTIAITRNGLPWPPGAVFSMRFDGPRGLTISTTRQRLSDSGRTLSVSDTGFGNVLDGLEFNEMATAVYGSAEVALPLDGAAPEVRAFRACVEGGLV